MQTWTVSNHARVGVVHRVSADAGAARATVAAGVAATTSRTLDKRELLQWLLWVGGL
jgi:hypothetical protein